MSKESTSIVVLYFVQHMILSHVNGATDILSTSPYTGYNSLSELFIFSIISIMISKICIYVSATIASSSITYIHIHIAINFLCYLYITLNMKTPKFLIIQKSSIRHFL
jgi:hypothetical protein